MKCSLPTPRLSDTKPGSHCPRCRHPIRGAVRFCPHCGSELSGTTEVVEAQVIGDRKGAAPTGAVRARVPCSRKLRAAAGSLFKSAFIAALIAGLSFAIWQFSPPLASFVLLLGAFLQLAVSYRKRWPLGLVTCLLPPAAALGGLTVQFVFFRKMFAEFSDAASGLLLVAVLIGALLGVLRASSHRVMIDNEQIFARRSLAFLVVWLIAYCITHAGALFGVPLLALCGCSAGAFSTAMLTTFGLVMLMRYGSGRRKLRREQRALYLVS